MEYISYQMRRQLSYIGAKTGVGQCYGTFGELLQGVLPEHERHFLVTLPISQYTTAQFTVLPESHEIHVFPSHKQKTRQLVEKLVQFFDLEAGGIVHLQSDLPEGKGYASSSADMVAASIAIESAFGLSIPTHSLARIMADIEPSDGVMYQGVVSFYHQEGVLRNFLGFLPPLTIVALDEGGQIDTIKFNKRLSSFGRTEQLEYEILLQNIELAITQGDLLSLGQIATRSTILNQSILPKAHLGLLLDISRRYNVLGVVTTHSGPCIGLLLDQASPSYTQDLRTIIDELAQYYLAVNIHYTHNFYEKRSSYAF